jgi:hypothetical protein
MASIENCASYNWENRLTTDKCALEDKSRMNKEFEDYRLYNFYTNGMCSDKLKDFSCEYPNLWFRKGYGTADSCVVDDDTKIQRGDLTHIREKRQMNTRTFHAVPNLSRGCLLPITESKLVQGTCEKSVLKSEKECDILVERNHVQTTFVPMLDVIQEYVNESGYRKPRILGINTREQLRKKCRDNINE